jgi:hypothetical protein
MSLTCPIAKLEPGGREPGGGETFRGFFLGLPCIITTTIINNNNMHATLDSMIASALVYSIKKRVSIFLMLEYTVT